MSRQTTRVRSIAIGGKDEMGIQRRAVSLELVGEPVAKEPVIFHRCDWERFCMVANLDRTGRAVFMAKYRDDEPSPGRRMGLTHNETIAIIRRILRKAQANPDEIRSCFREVSELDVFYDRRENSCGTMAQSLDLNPNSRTLMKVDELNKKLEEARASRRRLLDRATQLEDLAKAALAEASTLAEESKERLIKDLIEDRQPSIGDTKKVEAVQAKARAAQDALGAAVEAIVRQGRTIEEIESEINARRGEIFMLEVQSAEKRAANAIKALADAAGEIQDSAARNGVWDVWNTMWPLNPKDPFEGSTKRQFFAALLSTALNMRRQVSL
jgi:hypothetical protein